MQCGFDLAHFPLHDIAAEFDSSGATGCLEPLVLASISALSL